MMVDEIVIELGIVNLDKLKERDVGGRDSHRQYLEL